MYVVEYAGKKYDFETVRAKMDDALVAHIAKHYGGKINRQHLVEEYVGLYGWWSTLRTTHAIADGEVVEK